MFNVAIVGCGYWGPNLIRNFNSLENCTVRAICDMSESRLAHMKTLYPATETTTDFDALINDPEIHAIAIATPVHTHFKLAEKSLNAGKHTLIEKPMAASVDECLKLKELAEKNNLTLMVGHTFLYSQPVRRIKEIVKKGDLGDSLYYISARRLNLGLFQRDINVAWDLAPHDISIILFIMEADPVSVNCQGKAHVNKGIEDITNMTIDFNNGGFATINSSWLDPNKIREMTFVGSKRMLVYNDLEPNEKVKIYDKRVETPPHYDTFADFQHAYHYGDMYSPYIKQDEPLKIECQHFLDCIESGATPLSGAAESLRVVQVLEAASQSLKNGGNKVEIEKKF
jgi:predicted dehydrogenase